jgi:hypothetical protein
MDTHFPMHLWDMSYHIKSMAVIGVYVESQRQPEEN